MKFPSETLPSAKFPDTKYMGSKQAILDAIMIRLRDVSFHTVLDAFSGSACVAYALKQAGKRVTANDLLRFAYHTAKATVENSTVTLDADDVRLLLQRNLSRGTFIRETFTDLF